MYTHMHIYTCSIASYHVLLVALPKPTMCYI